MQTKKNSKDCQIISFSEAKLERDDRKKNEEVEVRLLNTIFPEDFEITEENQAAELRLLQTIFPGEFEAMVH